MVTRWESQQRDREYERQRQTASYKQEQVKKQYQGLSPAGAVDKTNRTLKEQLKNKLSYLNDAQLEVIMNIVDNEMDDLKIAINKS